MNYTKMTVKIYEPLLDSFDKQLVGLCLKRDAFLNQMIKVETPHLKRELEGRRLSAQARRYIAGSLKRLGTKSVNVVVDTETATALKDVVQATNIVRDAFVNRLLMFLRSSDALLKRYRLPQQINWEEFKIWYEDMPTSPLKAMEAVFSDPLYYLRLAVRERHGTGLYLLTLPETFVGFSCYLDDASVPGTQEYTDLDAILRLELDRVERDAFATNSATPAAMKEA
jgi:hypothetical protein